MLPAVRRCPPRSRGLSAPRLARSCRTHRQDCSTWHSDSSKDHRRRRNRCRNCWLFCKKPATATFEMHAARWASRNARPEASSLEPRSICSWSDSVTPSRMQTSRSKSRHGGATPERRCCATLPRSTSPWSSVVVAGPWSSRSCRAAIESPGLHRFMTNAHQSGTVGRGDDEGAGRLGKPPGGLGGPAGAHRIDGIRVRPWPSQCGHGPRCREVGAAAPPTGWLDFAR